MVLELQVNRVLYIVSGDSIHINRSIPVHDSEHQANRASIRTLIPSRGFRFCKEEYMEAVGATMDGEWSSLNGVLYSTEEADFMAQLLGNWSLPNGVPSSSNFEFSSAFWPSHESDQGPVYSSDDIGANMYSFSQGSSYSDGSTNFLPISAAHQYCPGEYPHQILVRNESSVSINYYIADGKNTSSSDQKCTNNTSMETGNEYLNQDVSNNSMESSGEPSEGKILQFGKDNEMPLPETSIEDKEDRLSEISKKRFRIPIDVKNKRTVKPKQIQKLNSTDHNDENDKHPEVLHPQHSNNCLSDDDSNASHELNGRADSMSNSKCATTATLNLNGRTRASRGSATDPQSLYARKRRDRINERLRILQNLVPNGTKVDISTMLEEAVQYVKFLQLQIKLLSSDDLWMYAPIAYNGMNIGLDLKIGTSSRKS